MLILTAGCVAVGLMPGLLLVPIAAIQQSLGLPAIAATWTGPLPGTGGWHPALLSSLLLVLAGVGGLYLRLGRAGGAVIRSPLHLCGAREHPDHVGASNLYQAPEAAIRGLLHANRDTGYSDDDAAELGGVHPA
jgi:hypothetical protein